MLTDIFVTAAPKASVSTPASFAASPNPCSGLSAMPVRLAKSLSESTEVDTREAISIALVPRPVMLLMPKLIPEKAILPISIVFKTPKSLAAFLADAPSVSSVLLTRAISLRNPVELAVIAIETALLLAIQVFLHLLQHIIDLRAVHRPAFDWDKVGW